MMKSCLLWLNPVLGLQRPRLQPRISSYAKSSPSCSAVLTRTASSLAFSSEWHRGQESRAADSRGVITMATRQTATEIAKVIPIACDLPHPIYLASAIALPPSPVPSV
jgi:hypothetical protein